MVKAENGMDDFDNLGQETDEILNSVINASEGTSKLDEVVKLARKYNLDDATYADHILARHGYGSTGYSFKSKFTSNFDVLGGIDEVLAGGNSIIKPNTGNRAGYIFEQTFDSVIGYNNKGKVSDEVQKFLSKNKQMFDGNIEILVESDPYGDACIAYNEILLVKEAAQLIKGTLESLSDMSGVHEELLGFAESITEFCNQAIKMSSA